MCGQKIFPLKSTKLLGFYERALELTWLKFKNVNIQRHGLTALQIQQSHFRFDFFDLSHFPIPSDFRAVIYINICNFFLTALCKSVSVVSSFLPRYIPRFRKLKVWVTNWRILKPRITACLMNFRTSIRHLPSNYLIYWLLQLFM